MKGIIKNKKIIIGGLILVFVLVIFVVTYKPIKKYINRNRVEKNLTTVVTKYYDDTFSKFFPIKPTNDVVTFTLNDLKVFGQDVELFEKYACNFQNTSATLTFNEKGYEVTTKLDCKFD